jgi:ABC-type molybdate transport system permease subunit
LSKFKTVIFWITNIMGGVLFLCIALPPAIVGVYIGALVSFFKTGFDYGYNEFIDDVHHLAIRFSDWANK